jgi:hypothetical protein
MFLGSFFMLVHASLTISFTSASSTRWVVGFIDCILSVEARCPTCLGLDRTGRRLQFVSIVSIVDVASYR